MEEIGPPLLPDAAPPPLPLGPIAPLLEYLDKLEQTGVDRALTWKEDESALGILKSLIPEDSSAQHCAKSFGDPRFRKRRTLAQWYLYARHLAEHLASED